MVREARKDDLDALHALLEAFVDGKVLNEKAALLNALPSLYQI